MGVLCPFLFLLLYLGVFIDWVLPVMWIRGSEGWAADTTSLGLQGVSWLPFSQLTTG